VSQLDQLGPRAALSLRDFLRKRRLIHILRRVTVRTIVDTLAADHGLGLGNRTTLHLQSQGHMRRLAMLFDGSVPHDVARGRIGCELPIRTPCGGSTCCPMALDALSMAGSLLLERPIPRRVTSLMKKPAGADSSSRLTAAAALNQYSWSSEYPAIRPRP